MDNQEKRKVPSEVSAFFAEIGRKNGKKLMEERGSEYFKNISKMRKRFGRRKKVEETPKEEL